MTVLSLTRPATAGFKTAEEGWAEILFVKYTYMLTKSGLPTDSKMVWHILTNKKFQVSVPRYPMKSGYNIYYNHI